MAKGSTAKEEITKKILEVFQGSFPYDKEIRIPWEENGEQLQIKCVLTCAKVNVSAGNDTAVPTAIEKIAETGHSYVITQEEKEKVVDLINKLNL